MKKNFTVESNERLQNKFNESKQSETMETMDYSKLSIPVEDSTPSFTKYEDEEDVSRSSDINEEEDQVEFDKYISSTIENSWGSFMPTRYWTRQFMK